MVYGSAACCIKSIQHGYSCYSKHKKMAGSRQKAKPALSNLQKKKCSYCDFLRKYWISKHLIHLVSYCRISETKMLSVNATVVIIIIIIIIIAVNSAFPTFFPYNVTFLLRHCGKRSDTNYYRDIIIRSLVFMTQ